MMCARGTAVKMLSERHVLFAAVQIDAYAQNRTPLSIFRLTASLLNKFPTTEGLTEAHASIRKRSAQVLRRT